MASFSFASESLMDPRIQVKLDKYQKCGNIISQTSLLSSYTGSETDADSDSVAQLVALMSGVVLGGVAEVVGSNLARGKIFTASIGSVDSLYPSVFIYCLNLHQFLILCSSKAMMFVKLYFRTSDIYLISLVSLDPSGFHLRTKKMPSIEKEPIYDVYCISRHQYQRFLNILFWG